MANGRATVQDVARLAGVAPSTVSNVLNHPERVDAPTAQRVRDAISKLGYIRNRNARELRLAETKTVGLILAAASVAFYWELEQCIEDEFGTRDYTVLVANSGLSPEREARNLRTLVASGVAGILVTPMSADISRYEALESVGVSCVLIDYPFENEHVNIVSLDHYSGGSKAVDYLLSLGSNRIGIATGPYSDNFLIAERYRGARDAVRRSPGARLVEVPTNSITSGGREIAAHIARSAEPPDAFFAPNDMLALSLIDALRAEGLRVPQDVAVMGYDDVAFPGSHESELTTMGQDARGIAQSAVRLLLESPAGAGAGRRREVFTPRLVRRETA